MCFQQNKRTNYYPTSELRWLMTRSTIEGSEKWFKRQLSYLIFPLSFSLSIAWCSLPYAVIIIVFVTSPSSKRVWMVDGTVCVQRRWQTMCAIEQLRESTIVTSMVTVGPKSGASTLCTFFSLYFILQGFFFSLRFLFRKFHSNLFFSSFSLEIFYLAKTEKWLCNHFTCRIRLVVAKKVLICRTLVFNEDNARRRTANDLSSRECMDVHRRENKEGGGCFVGSSLIPCEVEIKLLPFSSIIILFFLGWNQQVPL